MKIFRFVLNLITLLNRNTMFDTMKSTIFLTVFPYIHTLNVDRMEVNNLSAIFRVISFFLSSFISSMCVFFSSLLYVCYSRSLSCNSLDSCMCLCMVKYFSFCCCAVIHIHSIGIPCCDADSHRMCACGCWCVFVCGAHVVVYMRNEGTKCQNTTFNERIRGEFTRTNKHSQPVLWGA